jgi:site-specific recombinase XerC
LETIEAVANNSSPLASFIYALDSRAARREYPKRLDIFLKFAGMPGKTVEERAAAFLAKNDTRFYQDVIISFITYNKERVLNKELAAGTLNMYYHTIKLFCDMNDISEKGINWQKISRGLPKARILANDRAPTLEEIRKLMEYADRRMKMLVTVMFSSGIRVGAWEYLQLKHVIPVKDGCAKLIVYDGENERYYTFITPEAHQAIKEWIAYRESYGEKISPESYLMRDLWPTTDTTYESRAATGLATHPKKLKTTTIQKMLSRALKKQGIRQPLKKDARRHPFKLAHGLRKAFRSKAGLVMHHLNVELIMGHKTTGTQETYWRPTEEDVLEDYLRAVDLLTINSNVGNVNIHVTDKEIEELKVKQAAFESVLKKMVANDMDVDINDPEEQDRIASVLEKVLAGKWRLFTE